MTTGLRDFFTYHLWANQRLLDACAQLTDEQLDATFTGVFGSVRQTLIHMFSSEEGYTRRLTGQAPTPLLYDLPHFPGFDELRRRATASGEALIAFAKQVEPEALAQILHLDEGTYDAPMIIVVMQAIQHGIDHRSQIATLFSLQRLELPDLDSWAYNDATFLAS